MKYLFLLIILASCATLPDCNKLLGKEKDRCVEQEKARQEMYLNRMEYIGRGDR